MKKYDKIYVPAESKKDTDYYMDNMGDTVGLTEFSNRIVITIEELRDIWDKGYVRGCEEFGKKHLDMCDPTTPNLDNYLKSKGIDPTK